MCNHSYNSRYLNRHQPTSYRPSPTVMSVVYRAKICEKFYETRIYAANVMAGLMS